MTLQIEDYIQGEEHFIPIRMLPIVALATRMSDTLDIMTQRGVGAALVQRSTDEFCIFLPAATAGAAPGNPLADEPDATMDSPSVVTYPVVLVDSLLPVTEIAYGGPPSHEFVGVLRGGRLIGLLTQHEFGKEAATSPARIYKCTVCGLAYHPPPPQSCALDGGALGES